MAPRTTDDPPRKGSNELAQGRQVDEEETTDFYRSGGAIGTQEKRRQPPRYADWLALEGFRRIPPWALGVVLLVGLMVAGIVAWSGVTVGQISTESILLLAVGIFASSILVFHVGWSLSAGDIDSKESKNEG